MTQKNETKQKERGRVTPKEEEIWTGGGAGLGRGWAVDRRG